MYEYILNNDRTVINKIKYLHDLSVMKSKEKDELLLKLASRVKELRIEKNLTQEDAFNDTGIHFGRIEQGKRDISFTSLKKICDYFNLSLIEFFSKGF